ncbi:MAG: EI24 domain-containing protein [Beutenbergiaceae bacterium]
MRAKGGLLTEFGRGAGLLGRGFGWWRRRPGVMAAALIPAVLVMVVVLAALVVLVTNMADIAAYLTPFADDWDPVWAMVLRAGVGLALFVAATVASATTFTGLTLLIGGPFYDRIWRSVEAAHGSVPESAYGFWATVADSLSLIARGIGIAVLSLILGFVPMLGGVLAAVVGASLSGWVLSDELTSRALIARGLDAKARSALRASARARVLGFGVATHVMLLIPFGAILTIPAAVAGSTLLSQQLVDSPST